MHLAIRNVLAADSTSSLSINIAYAFNLKLWLQATMWDNYQYAYQNAITHALELSFFVRR